MLDIALSFLVKSLNTHLRARVGPDFMAAELSRLVDDSGKWAIDQDRIGATLINVEEERALMAQLPETKFLSGRHVVLEPPLRLNLHVLFAANLKQYEQSLRYLAHVLTFFQAHPAFTCAEHPDLDPRIERLTVELLSLTYDQLNQIWTFVGAKQLPSAVYKVRLVTLQDQEGEIGVPVTTIRSDVRVS